ncbi:MAG: Hsp20 family protein [Bacteroidales bacterium]|nr:Hsp20 family protein [Bacteroidales bacterium]
MGREFSYSSFSRSFTLPDSVDEDKVSANHQGGVLTVTIPEKEEARPRPPRQIDIK